MPFSSTVKLCCALAAIAIAGPPAAAQRLAEADLTALRNAIGAAAGGNWGEAYADAAPIADPLPQKIIGWLAYSKPGAPGDFADIAHFIDDNPDWPGQKELRIHAEAALAAEPDGVAAAWLARHPPVSAAGRVRAAELLLADGDIAGGTAALRAAWTDGDFGPEDAKRFLSKHAGAIRPADDWHRLDRLLWQRETAAALSMLPRVGTDYRTLALARLALAAGAANEPAVAARVARPLRADPGLLYEEVRALNRKDMTMAAAQILLDHPGDPVAPAAWAAERQAVARRLLAGGDFRRAYRVLAGHGAIDGRSYADILFLEGFIALRDLHDPALALVDFARIPARTEDPWAKARALYWGGRAADADGKSGPAALSYGAGARYMATFYGQLAAHELGDDAPPRPVPEPTPGADERRHFDALPLVRATRIFFALGDRRHAKLFFLHLAAAATTPSEFVLLSDLAQENRRLDLAIAVADRAVAAGAPLLVHGYPTLAIASGGNVERPLLYAIMRQESGFAVDAVSRAGALGLMQLMPATASHVALAAQMPFSLAALTTDGAYNITLGRTYLEELLESFGGSYALTLAAYNAGPGRVNEWIAAYGDPRGGAIGMVDWIELIPIAETRGYVERVLENLQIYRAQADHQSAFSLVSDLAR